MYCVLCRLKDAINQRCSYAGSKLGRQTDDGRDGKHQIVQQYKVEVSEPLQAAVVAKQVKVGNACATENPLLKNPVDNKQHIIQ